MTSSETVAPDWEPVRPPYSWTKHGLVVIGDRYLASGRRQHVVAGKVETGLILDGADIFGEDDLEWRAAEALAASLEEVGQPRQDRFYLIGERLRKFYTLLEASGKWNADGRLALSLDNRIGKIPFQQFGKFLAEAESLLAKYEKEGVC